MTESKNEKDFNMVKNIMQNLQGLGIKFYLDDFGTGYSNFARIIGLPIDIVGRIEEDSSHDLSVLPMWKAMLNGEEFEVFPEEVIPSEMKANGCNWFKGR